MKWLIEWMNQMRLEGRWPVVRVLVRDDCDPGAAFAVQKADGWEMVMSPLDWLPVELEMTTLASFNGSMPRPLTMGFSVLGVPVILPPG